MASSHNVVLLVDAADLTLKNRIKWLSLRLLNFLTCRAGLGRVRWSYRFLNSLGGRCRPPRRSDLRELNPRSWEVYEEELEACWARSSRGCGTGGSRGARTHTALMDTLSDFQWDRPDISSPAKPAVSRGRRRGARLIPAEEPLTAASDVAAGPGCSNAVFLLSPCPHSRAQLGDFTCDPPGVQQVADELLSRGLQNLLSEKRVALHWLDTSDWTPQVRQTCDHYGYWTMVEVMQRVGGRLIPSECLLESSRQQAALNIPSDSVLCALLSSEPDYKSQFPLQDGVVTFTTSDMKQWECAVTLEPMTTTQKQISSVINIQLKGTMQNWNENQVGPLIMESWLLQTLPDNTSCLHFPQVLSTTLSHGQFLIADVWIEDLLPRTGILSPISEHAAVLSVICSDPSVQFDRLWDKTAEVIDQEIPSDLPDIVNAVLSPVFSSKENTTSPEALMPEWIKQELSQSSHWGSSIIERWYPLSGMSGASSNLMESFRLISAVAFDQDEQKSDQEVTHFLSELYQKKTDEFGITLQGKNHERRLPRTPVRQKIKTMPRALQMLNAARLNSKAQNLQPKGGPVVKSSQTKRRSSEKPDGKSKKQTGFKSEEELNSFLTEDYKKMVSGEDESLLSWVRNTFTTIKSFWKLANSQHIEVDCMDKVKLLLKTSKVIRLFYGQNENKLDKLRECQIQALLRLENCVQCPSLQTNEDELEQVVEEITDMLRIISLTEDPSYLTKFLADVLTEYIGSIPKILADIYFSLGIQIPEELKLVLPADGDDSFLLDGKTPMYAEPSISQVLSVPHAVNEEDQLEELRTRSAKKRRTNTVARHRSITESSQSLRQIELPKKPLNRESSSANLVVMVEKLKLPLPAETQKDSEATKARRNLFVQVNRSPTRRGNKIPRSQSVSAVEGLKHKRSKTHDGTRDHCQLLTKKVTETPVHKQMAKRLLYKQMKGRCSKSISNVSVVEESPEKELSELDLRRSPRIKQLAIARKNSSFYASQPKSRNLERVHSATHQMPGGSATQPETKTPKDLLFGEVLGLNSPPTRRARRKLLAETDPGTNEVLENSEKVTPRKVQQSVPSDEQSTVKNRLLQNSHRIPRTPVCTPKTPSKISEVKRSAAKNLGRIFSPSKIEEKTPSKSAERRSERLARTTPSHSGSPIICLVSPLKTIGQPFTPRKEGLNRSLDQVFSSPQKTPQKSANTNTPAKMAQVSCTPRKSPRLQSLNKPCVKPTRYVLQTPVKKSEAPTPKKRSKSSTSILPSSVECTPEKATFFFPRKTADCSQSNVDILSMTTCRPILETPTKSIQKDVNLSRDQQDVDLCKYINPVNNLPFKEADGGLMELDLPSTSVVQNACETAKVLSPSLKSPSIYKVLSRDKDDPIVLCERLDMSSLESSEGTESLVNTSQTDESIDITEAKIVPTESSDLKMKVLIKRKSSEAGLLSHVPRTPGGEGDTVCTSPYGLRCTVNRRQREAEARLGTPQIPAKFSTPKNQKKLNTPPVYEVELEMQASGLPKLRFKRTDSNATVDMATLPKTTESPNGHQSKRGNESPFGETWCNKHTMKLESACTSPCLRSSHNTPGKSGLQTLICQTYTPKRSSSNTASPSEALSPWTPSPKYKDKNGSDVINNWPRKKKAFPVKCAYVLRQEKNQDYAGSAPSVEEASVEQDVVVEGVSKLLEQSPVFEWKGKTEIGAMSFKSRKRCFDFLSPTKNEPNSKRSCASTAACEDTEECIVLSSQTLSSDVSLSQQSSCEDEVFDMSTFTPPNKVLKNSLSASGLLALTQSPMLFKGKTPATTRKKQDSESQNSTPEIKRPAQQTVNMEDSPFSQISGKRTISRTYTRKKLIP